MLIKGSIKRNIRRKHLLIRESGIWIYCQQTQKLSRYIAKRNLKVYPIPRDYWSFHEYHRLNVKDFVEMFCSWKALLELTSVALEEVEVVEPCLRAFYYSLVAKSLKCIFLKRDNFEVRKHDGIILVRNICLCLQYY